VPLGHRAVLVVLALVAVTLAPAAVSASRRMMRGGMAREAIVAAEWTGPVGLGAVREPSAPTELPALRAGRAHKLLRVSSARAAVPLRRPEAPSPGPAAADSKPPLPQAMRKLLRERVAPAPAPVHLHEAHDARAPGPGASPGDGLPDVIAPVTVADGSAMLRAFLQLHESDPDAQVRQHLVALAVRLLCCCLLRARVTLACALLAGGRLARYAGNRDPRHYRRSREPARGVVAAARPADQRVGCRKRGVLHPGSPSWQPVVGCVAGWPVLLSFHAERSLPDLTPTALPQTLFEISPSLASLVDLHEPDFVEFRPTPSSTTGTWPAWGPAAWRSTPAS